MEKGTTFIKIQNYEKGTLDSLEKSLSVWDKINYNYITIGYLYDDYKHDLYLPASLYIDNIDEDLKTINPNRSTSLDFEIKLEPRDSVQRDAIDFLVGRGKFASNKDEHELMLALETGYGKTFCALYSALILNKRILIIVPNNSLAERWIDFIVENTNLDRTDITRLDGTNTISKIMNGSLEFDSDISIVTHSTLTNLINSDLEYGGYNINELFKKMKIGTKIIDEAHMNFRSTILINLLSNINKNIYLTATTNRSDLKEDIIFRKVFAIPTFKYTPPEKHIKTGIIKYNSNPTMFEQAMCKSKLGLNVMKYFNYTMKKHYEFDKALRVFLRTFLKYRDGKAIILCGYKAMIHYIEKYIETNFPDIDFGLYYSGMKESDKKDSLENKELIISTFKSLGTGVDIKGLKFVCMCEPYRSKIIASQAPGRLREEGWYFELVDVGFKSIISQYNSRIKYLETKSKFIKEVTLK